jgi:glycosyltransferase involved in cell wall biosynthesis
VEVRRLAFGGAGKGSVLARELLWYPFALGAASGLDVLHCPTYYGPLRPRSPLVVTVHDVSVLRHPEAFPRWTRTFAPRYVPLVLRSATRLIAVSEFTRREVVELVGVPEERIHVIPNAVEDVFTPEGPAADGDYVLAVGTLEPRKNLERLAEAARSVGAELRVIGARGWGDVPLDGVQWLGELSDEELARMYRGARVVAYPSLYEGFGIPVLEAMASGAPVVTSAGGATEEIAGGAAVLVDPLDPASIASGIEEAAARRDELRARGLERARAFTWDDVARRTVEVYREAARA